MKETLNEYVYRRLQKELGKNRVLEGKIAELRKKARTLNKKIKVLSAVTRAINFH